MGKECKIQKQKQWGKIENISFVSKKNKVSMKNLRGFIQLFSVFNFIHF